MQYVDFGKKGLKLSRFGVGCMRFKWKKYEDGREGIDEDLAISLIRHAIDNGVNYFDTAYAYAGSEEVLGKALKDGYREKAVISTKFPIWEPKSYEECRKYFDIQLKRLQTDYIDILFIHNVNQLNFDRFNNVQGKRFMNDLLAEGRIGYKGFSFHGDPELFKKVVDYYDWDVCLIQLNYLDQYHQAGIEGLKYAAEKGLDVFIMEPLRGGFLADKVPPEAQKLIDEYPVKRSPAEWSFRWLYNLPEVTSVLSGINTMEQLEENIRIFSEATPNVMSKEELEFIDKLRDAYNSKTTIGCTGCAYCMPCPAGVVIPDIFKVYNDIPMYGELKWAQNMYNLVATEAGRDASKCLECGKCLPKCPQGISIIEKLKEAHEILKVS
jgi:predicted aldo/keto reductase-like oxidoreductase